MTGIIIPGIFIVWAILRYFLQNSLDLVKEYDSLIILLEPLNKSNNETTIWGITKKFKKEEMRNPNWKLYFEEKTKELDRKCNNIHTKLNKIKQVPYRLWFESIDDIRKEFCVIVYDNYELYLKFIEMVNDEGNIYRDESCDKMIKVYNDFFSVLNHSRIKFSEINEDFSSKDKLFSPLPEPPFSQFKSWGV